MLVRRVNKTYYPMGFNLKSCVIIMIIGLIIGSLIIHRRSAAMMIDFNGKEQRLFQCQRKWEWSNVSPFYDVDCGNPFLKLLVNISKDTSKSDLCDNFDPLYSRITDDFRSFKSFQSIDFNKLLTDCSQCHYLQIIDGKLYVVPRSTSRNYQTRSQSIKTLFKYVINTFNNIPNMEFLFHVGDSVDMKRNLRNPSKCPVFGFARKKKDIMNDTYTDGVVTIPCFSFLSWSEAGINRWDKKMISIKQVGDTNTFDKRINKLFWRGAPTGNRAAFVSIAEKYQQIMDISFMNWKGHGFLGFSTHKQYRTLEQHCDYKYLLHLEGNTFSGRLKYLLLCGSPITCIFAKTDEWEEFWYHLLKHKRNIILIDSHNETLLLNMTNYLIENSERASQIGINGRNIVLKYLNQQAIICYMRNVLQAFSKLINYQVIKRDKATQNLF
jgi:hypothetical protein